MSRGQNLPTINKPVENFLNILNNFLKHAKGTNRGEIQKWLDDDYKVAKKVYLALKKEQEISTIMSPKGAQKLNSFFYIPKLTNTSSEEVDILELFSTASESSTLILGRLGQGKSIFLRYLQFLALSLSQTIPIFIELRKIKESENIEDTCIKKLNLLGLECSRKLFDHLLVSGHLSIFLDGFDETSFERRDHFCEAVVSLSNKATPNRVFVTSRFNTEIEQVAGFKSYKIKPLTSDDHPSFISKLISDEEESKEIIEKIKEAKAFDPSVLDTPLMLTWFIMVFKVRRKIPKTKIGFYEELFKTILSRHDGLKLSFDRQSKSGLSDNEIETVLYAFCYLTSKDNKRDFEHNEIISYIQQAINISKMLSVKSEDYLFDLTNITCLIVKDGITYDFIHSTIQSYFSACFIKETTETNASLFYSKADFNRHQWADELSFLFHLDSYRFYKFMVIPTISQLSGKSEAKIYNDKSIDSLNNKALKSIYENSCLLYLDVRGFRTYLSAFYVPSHSYTCHLVFNDANLSLCDTDKRIAKYSDKMYKKNKYFKDAADRLINNEPENKKYNVLLLEVLQAASLIEDFCLDIEEWTVEILNKTITIALDKINSEEMKEVLF